MRLLFIASEAAARTECMAALKAAGFVVDCVPNLEIADEALCGSPYATIVIGNNVSPVRAIPWLRARRQTGSTIPILTQLENDRVDDRIAAFEAGADDCFRAPVAGRELVARLRAALRRPPQIAAATLQAGNAKLDPETREVWVDNVRIKVPRREVGLLEQLMRRYTRVVPRLQLESNLYGMDDDVAPNSIEVGVSRIRRRLLDANATVEIHTVRGVGYCLSPREPNDVASAGHGRLVPDVSDANGGRMQPTIGTLGDLRHAAGHLAPRQLPPGLDRT